MASLRFDCNCVGFLLIFGWRNFAVLFAGGVFACNAQPFYSPEVGRDPSSAASSSPANQGTLSHLHHDATENDHGGEQQSARGS